MDKLSQKFGINTSNLDQRRRYIGLDQKDVKLLRKIAPWGKRIAPRLIKDLYDYQFSFSETRAFLHQFAAQMEISPETLRARLEKAQLQYFQQIFLEAEGEGAFGTQYFERRLEIGLRHNRINLPPKWYIGMYSIYSRLIKRYLRIRYFHRPVFRTRVMDAFSRVFNYDLQAVVDSFILDLFSSYGVDLDSVRVESKNSDLTDHFGDFKNIIINALSSVVITSHEVEYASHEVKSAANTMVEFVEDQAVNVKQALLTLEGISKSAQNSTQLAQKAGELATANGDENADSAVAAIDRIKESSIQVTEIIGMIDSIAFQTKLLALNAAVEAARAGAEGRGFAVVASEVRNLADRSAEASREVKDLIEISSISVQSGYILIHQLAELISQIVTTSEQQSHGVGGVTSAMRELTDAIQKSTSQSYELRKTAATMTKHSTQLNKVAELLSMDSDFGTALSQSSFAQDYLADLLADKDEDEEYPEPSNSANGKEDEGSYGFF